MQLRGYRDKERERERERETAVEIPCSRFFKRHVLKREKRRRVWKKVETESPWGLRRHYTPGLSADAPKTILNSRKSCEGPLSFANSLPTSAFLLPAPTAVPTRNIIPRDLSTLCFARRNSRERKTKTVVWSFPPSGRPTFRSSRCWMDLFWRRVHETGIFLLLSWDTRR